MQQQTSWKDEKQDNFYGQKECNFELSGMPLKAVAKQIPWVIQVQLFSDIGPQFCHE